MYKALTISLLFVTSYANSHGGHDHDAPTKVAAPKGGSIKELENSYVEVVSKQKNIKIYLYDKNLNPKSTQGFKVELKAEIPRTKKMEPIISQINDTFIEADYDAKKLHRYTLHIQITDPSTGHNDRLKYTLEPRK